MNEILINKLADAIRDLRKALDEQQREAARALEQMDAGLHPHGLSRPVDLAAKADRMQELSLLARAAGVDADDIQALVQGKVSPLLVCYLTGWTG